MGQRVRDTVEDTVCSLKWKKFLWMGGLSVNDSNLSLFLILSSGFRRRAESNLNGPVLWFFLWCVFIYCVFTDTNYCCMENSCLKIEYERKHHKIKVWINMRAIKF